MLSTYRDMLAKTRFYKKQVIQSYIKRGYFPSDEEILAALADIDTRGALLDTYLSAKGSLFNTKEINYMFECIYKDLNILYEVLEDILVNDYNALKLDIEAKMTELEQKAYNLKRRMNEEVNSTTYGTTIFFQANSWKSETTDNTTVVSLGEMALIDGSQIALFANVNNIDAQSVYFKLESNEHTFYALPYNYNEDVYDVPGELAINRYDLQLNKNLIVNGNMEINLSSVDHNNDYKILGGSNMMKVTYKDNNQVMFEAFPINGKTFEALRDCYIEFYMIDDSVITYDFNMAPNHVNFSLHDGTIVSDKTITKIFLDVSAGFVCRFGIEKGAVWASCTDGLIQTNNSILYSGDWSLRDFQILEFVRSKKTSYKVSLILKSDETIINYLDCVYIKVVDEV